MAILGVVMVMVFGMVNQTSEIWRSSRTKIEAFQSARVAFESITRRLGQATLNTYWDYEFNGSGAPIRYGRKSELHFISGPASSLLGDTSGRVLTHGIFFQSPLGQSLDAEDDDSVSHGLAKVLNDTGFFISYDDEAALNRDGAGVPLWFVEQGRYRFRLLEMLRPSEYLGVYASWRQLMNPTTGVYSYNAASANAWFAGLLAEPSPPVRVLAENIIALVLLPRMGEADLDPATGQPYREFDLAADPPYLYDSRDQRTSMASPQELTANQLPPLVRVLMVAIDEPTARKLNLGPGDNDIFGIQSGNLFTQASPDGSDDRLREDLETLEATLQGLGVDYRVFETEVTIHSAKWSSQ